MTKTIDLSVDDVEKIKTYEQSIQHWSSEYAILNIKAKKMLDGIDNIYSSRQRIIDQAIHSAEIDPKKVTDVVFDPSGKLIVTAE